MTIQNNYQGADLIGLYRGKIIHLEEAKITCSFELYTLEGKLGWTDDSNEPCLNMQENVNISSVTGDHIGAMLHQIALGIRRAKEVTVSQTMVKDNNDLVTKILEDIKAYKILKDNHIN